MSETNEDQKEESKQNSEPEFSPEQLAFLGVESIDEAKSTLAEALAARQKTIDDEFTHYSSSLSEKQREAMSAWFGSEKKDQVNALKMLKDLGFAQQKTTIATVKSQKSAGSPPIDHAAKHAELKKTNPLQAAAYFAAHGREIMNQKKGA